jgi:hypothetical protein
MITNYEKLSLEKCKEVLNCGEKQYTNEEVILIRDFLYKFAAFEIENYQNKFIKQPCEVFKTELSYSFNF